MNFRHPAIRLLACATALVVGATVTSPAHAGADTATASLALATSPTAITVSWTPTDVLVESWTVVATRVVDGSPVGRRTTCATCASARFEYLTPGDAYRFVIAGLGAPSGTVWATAQASTPPDPLCVATATCVAVDVTSSLGPATGVGRGLLMGLTSRTDPKRVAPLALSYHRIGAVLPEAFAAARQAGGQIDVILSNPWMRHTRQAFGRPMNPWEDWDYYRAFVVAVVQWHLYHQLVPDFWEIQNEPDEAAWYPTTAAGMGPTRDRVLQQFEVAHDAIRSVLPDAKIVGPSVGRFVPVPNALIDMESFLDAAVAKGQRFDVIAWHEMGGDCLGACDGGPRGIAHNVATLRDLLDQRPSLGQPAFHVNEFAGPDDFQKPGHAAAYMAAFAASGVTAAGSSCWPADYGTGRTYNGCYHDPGTMDNLLMPDGSTPTATWWTWRAHAQMTGQRLATTTSLAGTSAQATRSPSGTIDLLVGRHDRGLADAQMRVRVVAPPGVRRVKIDTTVIPHTIGPATPATTSRTIEISAGIIDLGTITMPANAALAVRIVGGDSVSLRALARSARS